MKLNEFGRHRDGKRFQARTYNGGKYQVYGVGLYHICECETEEAADQVANAIEVYAAMMDMFADCQPVEMRQDI